MWCAALVVTVAAGLAIAPAAFALGHYTRHNLVSDQAGKADIRDPDLVNAWGLAFGPSTPAWVADNGTDVSTLYTGDVAGTPVMKFPLTASIPGGAPTGQVFNGSSEFMVHAGGKSGPAQFIFSSEAGRITAWSKTVPPATKAHTVASAKGAIFKGLAIANTKNGHRLYATDFHNDRVDVFDGSFNRIGRPGAFVDRKLPRRFAPFGIQAIGGRIFVSYAKQDGKREDDVDGQGLGFVDAFDRNGNLLARVARRGQLNAPWGIARAPADFGRFSGDLLIGNFGDGRINAFKQRSGRTFTPAGALRIGNGKALVIDGLWALEFGHGAANNGPANTLFFTAGPDDEAHGLFGTITAG
jgi:uncharacterized protein (TIGR03118 family)